ncbi:hypothetical protein [Geodermatophilus sp. CPCC 205761]|uniref:hypothetical protein n=1 Tax=Geodermatophilus sp. CPCC 205761 TaxID=2936597 RepID=UPI003EEB7392
MPGTSTHRVRTVLGRSAGWLVVGLSTLYAVIAVGMAVTELLALLGAAPDAKPRVVPPLFVPHALTGAVALVTGAVPLQLGRPSSSGHARAHRTIGCCYLAAAWTTSVAGAATAVVFDVGVAGQPGSPSGPRRGSPRPPSRCGTSGPAACARTATG